MIFNKEDYKHFIIGENKICFPDEQFILKLDYPRVYIRLNVADTMFSDYEAFYNDIINVQWIDGNKPSEDEQEKILIDMYNYLAIEERILENDLQELGYYDEEEIV